MRRISSDSFESEMIAALSRERFAGETIRKFMQTCGIDIGKVGVVYYHARAHRVSMGDSRSDAFAIEIAAARVRRRIERRRRHRDRRR